MAASRIVFAYDRSSLSEAGKEVLRSILPHIGMLKVGLQAMTALNTSWCGTVGTELAEAFSNPRAMEKLLWDAKLHDIGNTMEAAARNIFEFAGGLTLHASASSEGLRAVAQARESFSTGPSGRKKPAIFGVTVLTDFDRDECSSVFLRSPEHAVLDFARRLLDAGIDGIVCSPHELEALQDAGLGNRFTKLIPGIRPEWAQANDQKRTMTPAEAVRAGADLLVIGRPILAGPYSPLEAVQRINEEIASA